MATDIVSGLFGVNPSALQRARQEAAFAEDYKSVQLTPMQQGNLMLRQGARALGEGLAPLLGGQDPEMAKATMARQLASQFDITSAEGLRQYAQALAQNGAPDLAQLAVQRADQMATTGLKQGKLSEETRLMGREIKEIGVPGNPELVQKAVVDKDGNIIRTISEPYSRFTTKQNISVDAKGETKFVERLGANDAETVTEAMKTRATALSTIGSLQKLNSLNNQELISGTFATGRVGAANLLATLGLASKDDVSRIATSQQYAKVAKDVIFQTLGGKLGVGFSNEDRRFIEALIPQLETSPEARRQLISYMIDKNKLIVDETTRLENYGRANNGLGGFDYKIPRETIAPPSTATKPEFTREQLQNEAARRGIK